MGKRPPDLCPVAARCPAAATTYAVLTGRRAILAVISAPPLVRSTPNGLTTPGRVWRGRTPWTAPQQVALRHGPRGQATRPYTSTLNCPRRSAAGRSCVSVLRALNRPTHRVVRVAPSRLYAHHVVRQCQHRAEQPRTGRGGRRAPAGCRGVRRHGVLEVGGNYPDKGRVGSTHVGNQLIQSRAG